VTTSPPQAASRAAADLRLSPDQLARHAADALAAAAGPAAAPEVTVVLGSGWKPAADLLGEVLVDLPATDVPGFRPAAVAGHAGRLRLVRTADGARVLVLGARTHLYEGHGVDAVAHGVRTAAAAGCRAVVLTNGCGSTVPAWGPGTVVLIRDHLNLTFATPLRGPRFVDMSDAYAARLRRAAREVEPGLPEGVYAQFPGPQYETPAEVRMARTLGADLVGMSTALETIAARAEGLEVLALSLVTNLAAGTTDAPLDHEEVLAAGAAAAERCGPLLAGVVGAVARATAA
jgi:purine-nucleoside phosphorylase